MVVVESDFLAELAEIVPDEVHMSQIYREFIKLARTKKA
jgi:hypothetical protein